MFAGETVTHRVMDDGSTLARLVWRSRACSAIRNANQGTTELAQCAGEAAPQAGGMTEPCATTGVGGPLGLTTADAPGTTYAG